MNDFEREKARQMMEHQKNMKDPDYAKVYQEMQRRKKEREKSEEALKKVWGQRRLSSPRSGGKPPERKDSGRNAAQRHFKTFFMMKEKNYDKIREITNYSKGLYE